MSEVKNERLEIVDVRAIVTDAFVSMIESALGMKAPDCAPPAFIQSAIDRAIDRINSEALAALAVRDARIATQEAQIKLLQSDANSWQSGYDEGRRMGEKHCMLTIDQLRAELAAIKAQKPTFWVADGVNGEVFSYSRQTPEYRPLYAAPVAKTQVVMQGINFTASNGEQRNPRYQGQFEGETPDQAAYRLHWVTAAIESERLNAADHLASHAYDEEAERAAFEAEYPDLTIKRCISAPNIYWSSMTQNRWVDWIRCAKSRARRFGGDV